MDDDRKKVTLTLMEYLTDIQLYNLLCQLDKIKGYEFSLNSLNLVIKEKTKSKEEGRHNFDETLYSGELFDIRPEIIPTVTSQIY